MRSFLHSVSLPQDNTSPPPQPAAPESTASAIAESASGARPARPPLRGARLTPLQVPLARRRLSTRPPFDRHRGFDDHRAIRILHVIDTLGVGGAETWLMALVRHWSKTRAIETDFLLTSGNRGTFDDEALRLGAKLHYLRFGRRSLPSFARGLRRLLREGGYRALHDHSDYVSGWHYLLAGAALPPLRVTHAHNPAYQIRNVYGVTLARRATAEIGKRLVARFATHITGTSRQVLTEYGFDEPLFAHIPKAALHCGFDTARFAGDRPAAKAALCAELSFPVDSRIILVAGRIDESPDFDHPRNHKSSALAVAVGIGCSHRDQRVRMIFAGTPSPAVPALESRIAVAGCADRIRFLGVRGDIERLMLASDLLLFPSRGEGLGMVAVEAQAAGLPVLASTTVPRECVVVPELVRFLDLGAGVERWAVATLEQAALAHAIRDANARVAASPFSIERSARALEGLYRDGKLP
jgi:glycosyltransferase involved in cell wall biosynthesis